jgi:hypothetical protein
MGHNLFTYLRILALVFASLSASIGAADIRKVSSPQELEAALSSHSDGQVISLAEGDYGSLSLRRFFAKPAVVLRSADPKRPARFSGMTLNEVTGLTLENVVFDYDFQFGDKLYMRPFQILNSKEISIHGALFEGDVARGSSPTANGYPTAFGLGVRNSSYIVVEKSEFREFYRGLVMSQSSNLFVRGNNVHSIRMDGMNFAEVQNVKIEQNHIHDFIRSLESKDHADMIQFWTRGTKSPSRNIIIRDNLLNSGKGWFTQSIFMRNDLVDRQLAGDEMFYQNITIENNLIINAHLHGITIGETKGLKIIRNTVVRNAKSEGKRKNPGLWIPQVRVAETSQNVEVSRNVVHRIVGVHEQHDWRIEENFLVQDKSRMKPGFYAQVFGQAAVNDPTLASSFTIEAGSSIRGMEVGASILPK